nr:hypothetical protein [Tanacetum cinerariifolium]
MEMEPDIKNMMLNEYLEYEAVKERRLWDNVRSKSSPTRYETANFNSSYHDKSICLDFPHYFEDAFIDKYYALPPLLLCFRPSQPHKECGYESPNTNDKVDINSMTVAKYNRYIAKQMKNPLNDHSYRAEKLGRMGQEKLQNGCNVDTSKDTIGAENLRRMGQEKIQHGCNVNTSRDTNHESGNAEVEDDDDGDTYHIWDITVKNIERIRQFLMPNIPDEMNEAIQPLIPQPIYTTPPNNDYVAPATKSILDELLEEFKDLIMNVTMVDEEAAKDPQSYFMEIQVHSVIIKPEPFIHTQPMSPLYGIFESYKSSIKPYKVDREMKSPFRGLTARGWSSRLCTGGGAWILNKLRGSITNQTSWMLYIRLVKFPVMLDVARGCRLEAWI